MEGNKLEISGRVADDPPPASYKQISEADLEDKSKERPVSLTKSVKSSSEMDGADEQMLSAAEKTAALDSKVAIGDVKFTNNEKQNGEAKLDIGEIKSAFVGMTKEELMKYATDPFWIRLRWVFFISFWLLWLGMLVGAIVIIIMAPKCAPPAPRTWWEQGPLTEVNHDIPENKLQEIKDKKIKGVIVPQLEDSYTAANDSIELLTFLQRANKLELNVIIELEAMSSRMWFEKSANKDEQYSNYYLWESSKKRNESGNPDYPNNWISPQGGSSWKFSEARGQFYYAPFTVPHLNFRNPSVVEELSEIIRQWLDAGAKGIRLKGAPFLLVDEKMRDETMSSVASHSVHTDYEFYRHDKTVNVNGIGEILSEWKQIVREHKNTQGPLMITESLNNLDPYSVNGTLSIDLPHHTTLFKSSDRLTSASQIYIGLNTTFSVLKDHWPLWEYGTEVTSLSADVLNMLIMLLPGCPMVPQNSAANNTMELVKIRQVPSVMFGATHMDLLANNTIFAYLRVAPGNPGYLVACNPTNQAVDVDFTTMQNVSSEVTIQALSSNYYTDTLEPSQKISAKEVIMPPKSAVILTYVPKSKE